MRKRLGLLLLLLTGSVHAQESLSSYTAALEKSTPEHATPSKELCSAMQPVESTILGPRAWVRAEYFMGFIRRESVPPLIITVPAATAGQMQNNMGGMTILYPRDGRRIDYNGFSGARIGGGMWLNDEQTRGIDVSGFVLEQRNQEGSFFSIAPNQNFLARFIIDANIANATVSLFGDNTNGPVGARGLASIDPIYSAEINYMTRGLTFLADRTDYLFGLRYFDQREGLQVDFRQNLNTGGFFSFTDNFSTTNQFYGANFGVRSHFIGTGRFGAETTFKVAAGNSFQRVNISGNTVINVPGTPVITDPQGIYARATNIGTRDRDIFTVIPEMNLRVSYAVSSRAKVFLGYDLIYISSVVRPGQAIDPVVFTGNIQVLNPTAQTQGQVQNRPFFSFRSTDETINAFSLGLSVEF